MGATAAETRELAEASREAGIVDDLRHGGSLWINAVAPLTIAEGYELAERMLAEAFEAAREQASMVATARVYVTRSFLRQRQGTLDEARADADAALATAGEVGFVFSMLSLAVVVEIHHERGDLDAARAALEQAGMAGEIPDTFLHNWLLRPRGLIRLAAGQTDLAIADFEELGRRLELRKHLNPAVYGQRSALALALLRDGDGSRARRIAEEEVDIARTWGAPAALGGSLRTLGLCRGEEGIEQLRESVRLLEFSGAQLSYARSLVELGAALRRARQRTDAREPLRTGLELAHRCGAPVLLEQAREELLATGARPRRIVRTGVDALTPSELRVARLAAEGNTNREIAQTLFVTQRTIETHLTHVFQKLEITSRGEVAARLNAPRGE